jgi:hypothetical protein
MRNYRKVAVTGIVAVLLSLLTTNISLVYADSQENHTQHQMEGMSDHEMHGTSNIPTPQEQQMARAVIGTSSNVDSEEHGSHNGDGLPVSDKGPDWPVLYGFGGFNLAVIAVAAFLKYTRPGRKEVG